MQFKGIVTVKKTNLATGKSETVLKENTVTKRTVEAIFMDDNEPIDDQLRIAISTDVYTPDYERITMDNIIAIGSISGAAGYVFTDGDPPFVTYENIFLPPTAPRNFSTFGLVTGVTDNDLANVSRDTWAYISFGSPFTQGLTDQFEITHKIFLDFTASTINLGQELERSLQLQLCDQNSLVEYEINRLSGSLYNENSTFDQLRGRPWRQQEFSDTETKNYALLKRKFECTINFPINRFLAGLMVGNGDVFAAVNPGFKGFVSMERFTTGNNLTPVFSHNETTEALFEDSANKANSDWQPFVTESVAHDDLPKIYSFYVDQGGGADSYLFYETLYSGGIDLDTTEEWLQRPHLLVGTAAYPYFFSEDDAIPYDIKWIYSWTDDKFWVSGKNTTVAIWQIYPEFLLDESWDLGVSNGVTKINDIATYTDDAAPTNNRIYAATEEGLFEINPNTLGITLLDSDRAMAVDVGFNGAVFAVLINTSNVGRLTSSLIGYSNSHSFTGTIDYSRVVFIRCDRESADYELGILELVILDPDNEMGQLGGITNGQTVSSIHWWDNVSNYVATIDCLSRTSSSSVYWARKLMYPYSSSFVVKDGVWLYPKYFSLAGHTNQGLRGYPRTVKELLDLNGVNLLNGAETAFLTTNINCPWYVAMGAAYFNQELRHSNTVSVASTTFHQIGAPSYAVVDTSQIASGKLVAIVAGFTNQLDVASAWSTSNRHRGCGVFDFDVSTTTPTINTYEIFEEANIGVHKYTFSMFSSSEVKQACLGLSGAILPGKNHGFFGFVDSSFGSDENDLVGVRAGFTNIRYQSLGIYYWGAPTKDGMFNFNGWSTRYGWNPTPGEWLEDNQGVYGGKPRHTSNDPLPQNLLVNWQDQDLGAVNNFIVDQHYEFGRSFEGVISGGDLQPIVVPYYFSLRPTINNYAVSFNVPATPFQFTLDAAPTGASPDPLWLSLDDEDSFDVKLQIAGVDAEIIYTGSPLAGQILIQDPVAGVLEFNTADQGKAITGTILYYQKIDPTEVL